MKNIIQKTLVLLIAIFALFMFTACEDEGPAERAGEKIDQTVENTKESMEEAGEAIEESAEETGEKLEEAGENLQNQ